MNQSDVIFIGIIKGMNQLGATFVKNDESYFYFDVKKGSEIDNKERLLRAKNILMKKYGMGLKVKRID
jgi:hypothetical protein